MTLGEARDVLRELVEEGYRCPCCTQFAKVYRRKVHSSMAVALISFYRKHRLEWAEWEGRQSDEAKLRYWRLMEAQMAPHGESGLWRITSLGEAWVFNRMTVKKYARIYDGRCLNLTGEQVTIVDALGTKFNYRDLMDGI